MNSMTFLKGMGAGLIVGACIGMAVMPEKKSARKTLCKAVKAMENVVSDVSDMMGL